MELAAVKANREQVVKKPPPPRSELDGGTTLEIKECLKALYHKLQHARKISWLFGEKR